MVSLTDIQGVRHYSADAYRDPATYMCKESAMLLISDSKGLGPNVRLDLMDVAENTTNFASLALMECTITLIAVLQE